ncbi:MAG TPA: transposase [Rhodopila sp.]
MSPIAGCCPSCCMARKPVCGAIRPIAASARRSGTRRRGRRIPPTAAIVIAGVVNTIERAKNRTKSKVRAKVEHSIGVIKRVFGFAKVRYRGLTKNAHRLIVTCALANLFIVRRQLLRLQET